MADTIKHKSMKIAVVGPGREIPAKSRAELVEDNTKLVDALHNESQAHGDTCVELGMICQALGFDIAEHAKALPAVEALKLELARYQNWVADLQSGLYVNCVYCGHRYGPQSETPIAMADVLKQHIAHCPKHPMTIVTKALSSLVETKRLKDTVGRTPEYEKARDAAWKLAAEALKGTE